MVQGMLHVYSVLALCVPRHLRYSQIAVSMTHDVLASLSLCLPNRASAEAIPALLFLLMMSTNRGARSVKSLTGQKLMLVPLVRMSHHMLGPVQVYNLRQPRVLLLANPLYHRSLYSRFYNTMGGRGIPGRGRGGPRGSPRGSRGSSPAPGGGGDRARGGGFRGRADFRGGPSGSGLRGRGRGGPPPPPLASLGAPRQSAEEQTRITELEKSIVRFKEAPPSEENPLRPGFGTLGTKILLRANFFQVQFKKGLIIYDYDVKIAPATGIARLKARIFELLEKKAEFQKFKPFIAHDRSQRMVCPRELPQPLSFDVPYVEEEETEARPNAKTYTVEINKTGELHTEEMSK